jgi:hypothetical protein
MSNGGQSINRTLGVIGLGSNNHPRGQTPKLDSVGDDPDERFYMLATFCFDLSRKLKYISLALKEFYAQAPPDWAKKIRDDEQYINPKPNEIPWAEMARRAEQVMKRLHAEVLDAEYLEILNRLADEGGE